MKTTYISVQASYQQFEVGLYREERCLAQISKESLRGSAQIIPIIDSLLQEQNIKLCDLSFIAIDRGPGAFTSLRVGITTVNALAFGSNTPLIGINGLTALAQETAALYKHYTKGKSFYVISLLNAYNNEVYCGVYLCENQISTAIFAEQCLSLDSVLRLLETLDMAKDFVFTGNGFSLHENFLRTHLGEKIITAKPYKEVCSIDQVAAMALIHWKKKEPTTHKLLPLYLKLGTYAVRNHGPHS